MGCHALPAFSTAINLLPCRCAMCTLFACIQCMLRLFPPGCGPLRHVHIRYMMYAQGVARYGMDWRAVLSDSQYGFQGTTLLLLFGFYTIYTIVHVMTSGILLYYSYYKVQPRLWSTQSRKPCSRQSYFVLHVKSPYYIHVTCLFVMYMIYAPCTGLMGGTPADRAGEYCRILRIRWFLVIKLLNY